MLVPEHIASILTTARIGTLGKTMFCHALPPSVTTGIVIMGDLSGSEIDHDLPGWRMGHIQVIVRDPSYSAGLTLSRQIITALSSEQPRDLAAAGGAPAIRLRRLRPIHDPIVFPRSPGDVMEFSTNYEGVWVVR